MAFLTEWTQTMVLEFLSLLEKNPVIWDPKNVNHRNRHYVAEAWNNINQAIDIDCTVESLKKKRDSLMAIYRLLKKKVLKSIKSGLDEEIYKPTWYAYEKMDSFLNGIGKYNTAINAEIDSENSHNGNLEVFLSDMDDEDELHDLCEEDHSLSHNDVDINRWEEKPIPNPFPAQIAKKKRKSKSSTDNDEAIMKYIKQASETLEAISKQPPSPPEQVRDEYSIYGELLAIKLRALNPKRRKILQNKIDNIVFQEEMKELGESKLQSSTKS